MTLLTVLKHLINFVYFAFIIMAILLITMPFIDNSYLNYSSSERYWLLVGFPAVHLILMFAILFYLRKFVLKSASGTPLDYSARKYLKPAGVLCLIFGLLKAPAIAAIIEFMRVTGEFNTITIFHSFSSFDSVFYLILIGVFLLYLSKVLESSDIIRQENKLTI